MKFDEIRKRLIDQRASPQKIDQAVRNGASPSDPEYIKKGGI